MKFIDEVHISVTSGKGGPGCVSFRRESHVPRGGPDGGDGGKGGDVIVRTSNQLSSLLDFKFKKHYKAQNGQPGKGANMSGPNGLDLILDVPPGTIVKDKNSQLIVDMAGIESHTLLVGGIGGKGNCFYKTSVHQAPEIAQKGMPAQELDISLELKIIADIGIIGFPNVGKSTLISRISAAKPKIADYHFTTLVPNLGVVKVDEGRNFVVADIPGLIEGAHLGQGLGIQFLRHIERTKAFVHLIDASELAPKPPVESYNLIMKELEKYDEQRAHESHVKPLVKREQVVAFSKIDVLSPEDLRKKVREFKNETGIDVLTISSVTGMNIKDLIYKMDDLVYNNNEDDDYE